LKAIQRKENIECHKTLIQGR